MADVNGAAALKPGIGIVIAQAGTSEGGAATLIGEAIFSSYGGASVVGSPPPLIADGIFLSEALMYENGNAILIANGTFTALAVDTTDAGASMTGCAALFAEPTFSTESAEALLGIGTFMATGNFSAQTEALVLLGVGKSLDQCYIANVEDYFNDYVNMIDDTPTVPCYHVHVNRLLEKEVCNAKMIMAPKCYPTEPEPPISSSGGISSSGLVSSSGMVSSSGTPSSSGIASSSGEYICDKTITLIEAGKNPENPKEIGLDTNGSETFGKIKVSNADLWIYRLSWIDMGAAGFALDTELYLDYHCDISYQYCLAINGEYLTKIEVGQTNKLVGRDILESISNGDDFTVQLVDDGLCVDPGSSSGGPGSSAGGGKKTKNNNFDILEE